MDTKPIRILLIEDDPDYAQIIETLLTVMWDGKMILEHLDHLSAGLERLAKVDVDLILLDLSLPDSQGLSTFTKIRRQAPHIPIIVLSGLPGQSVARRAIREGAKAYLIKGRAEGPMLIRAVNHALEPR
ncbi:MAG TPA: response regulator [Chloroflexi bacterium]|nr:response regulator [Chloroflexota bacterium]